MAVYKRTYQPYVGAVTSAWTRFLVLYRSARRSLFRSRFQTAFYVLCFFFPLLCLLGIYTNAHLSALAVLGPAKGLKLDVNGDFFYTFLNFQCSMAFLLSAFIGPGLVSPDLANGALTLYLCRPISRAEYILGKMAALVVILSSITWLPGLILFFAQAGVTGRTWLVQNAWIANGMLWGSFLWIFMLALLALALSAWVKWRIVAGALLLAIFFMGAGFAQAVNAVLRTTQGYLFDIGSLVNTVERALLHTSSSPSLSVGEASFALFAIALVCLLLLLRKVRANEVVI